MATRIDFVNNLPVQSALVRHFYSNNWKKRIALSEKIFYDWQFINTPDSENRDSCVIAYDDQKNEIVGVMGLNKRGFIINKATYVGAELTTWIVSERVVGSGLAAKMLQFIQDRFEVLIGMSIGVRALPMFMRSGFRYLKSIPRFVRVINFDPLKPYSSYSNLAVKLINKWNLKEPKEFSVRELSADHYDEVFQSAKERFNFFVRDNAHRHWRYDSHPYFRYKQFLVGCSNEESSQQSFVAFREELTVRDFKILHVMDLFGDDSSIPSAISFIESYARENGFDVIDFYCTSSSIYRFMLAGGWFSINDDPCFQFPHLFHPVEMRDPPTSSLIYWAKNNFSDMADLSKLYVTKQDADLDRPTMHTIEAISKESL